VGESRIYVPDGLGVAAMPLRRPPEVVTVWKKNRIVARLPKLPTGPYHLRVRDFGGDERSLMNGYVQTDRPHD